MEGVGHEGGPGLQGYYSSRGLVVLGTVMDGDCGIGVACQMLGLPQTFEQRTALREEISDYLFARVKKPWMQELMGTLQELDVDDVRQIHGCPVQVSIEAVANGVDQATAVAVADPVLRRDASVDQATAVAVEDPVLRRDAIGWATKSKHDCF